MPLHFYDGPAFSGRSEALKEFAWDSRAFGPGYYLHPMLEMNLSGLAETVAGELYLHGVRSPGDGSDHQFLSCLLTEDLPPRHPLRSLSGGETARLLLSCALATRSTRLALDSTLEQLDPEARRHVLDDILLPLSAAADIRVADNNGADLARTADVHRRFEAQGALDLNAPLLQLTEQLARTRVEAPTLRLEDLSFRYRAADREIFEKTSFSFVPGVPYLLKSPNGSGKSTLARLLLGVLKPDGGMIAVDGTSQRKRGSDKNLVFYAFQNPIVQMIANRTSAYLAAVEKRARERETWLRGGVELDAEAVLAGFGLEPFADTEPFDLPFAVLKRLSIAGSLVSRSPWLFFDEPAIGSDAAGREALASYFGTLCELGFGVIIVTHGVEFDGLPGARLITIRDGRLEGAQHGT